MRNEKKSLLQLREKTKSLLSKYRSLVILLCTCFKIGICLNQGRAEKFSNPNHKEEKHKTKQHLRDDQTRNLTSPLTLKILVGSPNQNLKGKSVSISKISSLTVFFTRSSQAKASGKPKEWRGTFLQKVYMSTLSPFYSTVFMLYYKPFIYMETNIYFIH